MSLPMLMSKSQATEIATALRRAARDEAQGLVEVGYQPRRGIVVAIIRNGEVVAAIHETGPSKLTSPLDTLGDPEV